MNVNFGTDGARGLFSNECIAEAGSITPEVGYRIGAAAVETFGLNRFVMVGDGRDFNPELAEAIKQGISSRGGVTADLGILPTPAGAFVADWLTQNTGRTYGSIATTASHNAAKYAGIKVSGANGVKLNKDTTGRLQENANRLDLPTSITHYFDQSSREFDTENLRELYLEILLKTVGSDLGRDFLKGRDIVIDAANGAASWSAPEIMRRLGANVILINGDVSAEINKNCGATHTDAIVEAVRASGASYGMALDGDADRLIAYARTGNKERLLDGDDTLAITLSDFEATNRLGENPETVTTDYSTVGFKREMDRRGIKVNFVENGDRYVLEGLQNGALVGGEKSGHTLYPMIAKKNKTVLSGDGTLAALQELQAEARIGKPLVEISDWPLLGYGRADIELPAGVNAKKLIASECVQEAVRKNKARIGTDGLILLRGSGTEPIARVLVKTENDQSVADDIVAELNSALESAM